MAEEIDHCVTHAHVNMNWEIKRFLDLPKEDNYCLRSPTFSLAHSKWSLLVYPNGKLSKESAGWIGLCLIKDKTDEECSVAFKMGINKDDGSVLKALKLKWAFTIRNRAAGSYFFIKKIRLTATQDIFAAADGSLWFFCSARIVNTKEIKKKRCQTIPPHVYETLVEDLKRLYLQGQNTDITIKIKNNYLKVHKCILAARSNVFAAMFSHNKVENRSDEFAMDSYDPNAFKAFIFYLYTGIFDTDSSECALNLFKIADMHFMKELKEECVRYMMRELSVDSFCDVVDFAIVYSEFDLWTAAEKFFYTYKKQILKTSKWKAYTSKHQNITNNLLSAFAKKRKRVELLQAKVKSQPNSG